MIFWADKWNGRAALTPKQELSGAIVDRNSREWIFGSDSFGKVVVERSFNDGSYHIHRRVCETSHVANCRYRVTNWSGNHYAHRQSGGTIRPDRDSAFRMFRIACFSRRFGEFRRSQSLAFALLVTILMSARLLSSEFYF
jgi:hypothetical protein